MSSAPRASALPGPSIAAIGLWLYCAGVAVWLFGHWNGAAATTVVTSWWVLPSQLLGVALVAQRLSRGDLTGPRRAAWWLLLVSILTDAVATACYGYLASGHEATYGTWVDLLYLFDYVLMTAICALLFVACGGDFRRRRVWLDGATLVIGLFAAVLPFLLGPVISAGNRDWHDVLATLGYAGGIIAVATVAGLLATQIADWRAEIPTLLIVAGFGIALTSDVWVTAGSVRGESPQMGLANLSYCIYGALFATAAALRAPRVAVAAAAAGSEGNVYGFLPVLTILLAIVVVLGTQVRQSGVNIATAAVLVLVGAVLLVARQLAVRHELARLNRELAIRQADARLTELVRRSSDAIAVINGAGTISYLSPASATVLGPAPGVCVGAPAIGLLGADNEPLLRAFVHDLRARRAEHEELEVELRVAAGPPRAVQVIGSDQSRNPLIDGVVLTLRDVSAERGLEREVLEIATRERQRLCAEIHEGLGQELVGIALLLRGASSGSSEDPGAVRAALQPIVRHVNTAIETVRTLARGLSPLAVVRGSLASALAQLAAETRARARLDVVLRNEVRGDPLTDVAADHLYRIAQESVAAAAQRRGCTRIEIALSRIADRLTLAVTDDGWPPATLHGGGDLGLRMLGYRARLLGGTVRRERPPAGGGRIEVTVPLEGAGRATRP